jgi:hypothetical protein
MRGFVRKVRSVSLACAVAAGLGLGGTAVTAAPARAANGPCYDITNSQPTALHFDPSGSSKTIKFLGNKHAVTGTCNYIDNTRENHWYMQVNYIGPDNNGGYGYIWVRRLAYGARHNCKYYSGQAFSVGAYYGGYGTPCPLYGF